MHPSSDIKTLRPDISLAMAQFDVVKDREGFIGSDLFPFHEVRRQAGPFGKLPLKEILRRRTLTRTSQGAYPRLTWKFEDDTYATQEYGLEGLVDERDEALYRDWFQMEVVTAELVLDGVLRGAEQRVADLLFNATTFTGQTTTVTNEWDDPTNATPITDVKNARQTVWERTGIWPNTLVINRTVFHNLRECDQILDRIAAAGAGDKIVATEVGISQLRQVFDLENILVGSSAQNTAGEGEDATIAPIWDNEYALICKTTKSPNVKAPCLGRTLHWSQDGSRPFGMIETYVEPSLRANVLRVRHEVQEKMLYVELGQLLDNITT